jgi:haloalkane dehalogenase
MAYTDAGAGEPVLLLHAIPTWSFLYAIPTWSFLYADAIPLLEPHYRVLAPDFLGTRRTDRPRATRRRRRN